LETEDSKVISHCQFTKGYPLQLPCIGKRRFDLATGVTILFGPNGCGKSTLLSAMTAYSSIKGGGWSRFQDPFDIFGISRDDSYKHQLPKKYTRLVRDAFEADVGWDGTPSLAHSSAISDTTSFSFLFDSAEQSHDGMTTLKDQIIALTGKASQGERRMGKLFRIFQMLAQPPTLDAIPKHFDYNDTWQEAWKVQLNYFKSLSHTGPNTILLDEPDRSLSIVNQVDFWFKVVPQLTKHQTIIATHSPFVFSLPYKTNLIDMQPGYFAECQKAMQEVRGLHRTH
jgi:predicted ATPase